MGRTESSVPGYAPPDEFDPSTDDFVAKERTYIHFDLPLKKEELAKPPTDGEISKNAFWPLLGFQILERRLKHGKKGVTTFEVKPRDIKFGSHRDAFILEWYSHSLLARYEEYLARCGYGQSVLAYRKGVGDNVTQAKDLFQEIRKSGDAKAIAMDIKGFFDNIDHQVLLAALKKILKVNRLADHEFKIFRRMTKFEWVDAESLKARLGKRYSIGGRICSSREFRDIVRQSGGSLIQVNPNTFGIPQGTPLSGLYANISMIEFDRVMAKYVAKQGGTYRRYSDDLAFVLPLNVDERKIVSHAKRQLKRFGLEANDKKTEKSVFRKKSKLQTADRPFQYLGSMFDGARTLIRPSSLNRYYRKMSGGVRAKIRAAKESGVPKDQIYMRELFRKYTHFGRVRNFPRYAYRSAEVLSAPEIRQQIKGHMRIFKRFVKYHLRRVYGPTV